MTVTSEMCQAVNVYLDECERVKGTWHRVEAKFTLEDVSSEIGGTSDFNSFDGKTLYVVDYKHGKGYGVGARHNPQLYLYALGGLKTLSEERPELAPLVKLIDMEIVQPRLEDEEPVKSYLIQTVELIHWQETELKPAIERTITESHKLVAGDHCKFCPAKAICPAQYQKNLAVAQVDFAKPLVVNPPAPASLTIDQLGRVLQAKDQLESWLSAIEAHAQTVLESGKPVPGFKLVKKRSNRAWSSEPVAEEALVKMIGTTAYKPRQLISPAEAEKQLKVLGVTLNEALVFKPDTGNVIAPLTDKRQAVSALPAATDFLQDADFLS